MAVAEQSDLEKQTDDSHNIIYQNAICYKKRKHAFMKEDNMCVIFSLVFVIKPGGSMTEIF